MKIRIVGSTKEHHKPGLRTKISHHGELGVEPGGVHVHSSDALVQSAQQLRRLRSRLQPQQAGRRLRASKSAPRAAGWVMRRKLNAGQAIYYYRPFMLPMGARVVKY